MFGQYRAIYSRKAQPSRTALIALMLCIAAGVLAGCTVEVPPYPDIHGETRKSPLYDQITGVPIIDTNRMQSNVTALDNNEFRVEVEDFDDYEDAQERPDWCWVAAVSMTLRFNDIPASQCDVIKSLGKDCHSSDLQFGDVSSIVSALNGIKVNEDGRAAIVQATSLATGNGAPLIDDLAHNRPPIVGFHAEEDGNPGHVYVLLSIRYSWTPGVWNMPVFWSVEMFDPFTAEVVTWSGAKFARRIDFAVRLAVMHV